MPVPATPTRWIRLTLLGAMAATTLPLSSALISAHSCSTRMVAENRTDQSDYGETITAIPDSLGLWMGTDNYSGPSRRVRDMLQHSYAQRAAATLRAVDPANRKPKESFPQLQ